MKKNSALHSGLFKPRTLLAFTLCSFGALLAMLSFASTPSSGTVTDTSGPLSYTAGPFFVANRTPVRNLMANLAELAPRCSDETAARKPVEFLHVFIHLNQSTL